MRAIRIEQRQLPSGEASRPKRSFRCRPDPSCVDQRFLATEVFWKRCLRLGEERIAVLESFDHRHHEATVGVPNQSPEIIEVNFQQMEELLDRAASNTLHEEDT